METLLKFITSMIILFVAVIASTVFGGVFAWCIGLLFEATILKGFAAIGIHGLSMFEIGATLGFVSGFFTRSK